MKTEGVTGIRWFYVYTRLFCIFNIDICNPDDTTKRCSTIFYRTFITFVWSVTIYGHITKMYTYIYDSKSKQLLATSIGLLSTFFIWCHMNKFQLKICNAIKILKKKAHAININPPTQFTKNCFFLFGNLQVLRVLVEVFEMTDTKYETFLKEISFGSLYAAEIDRHIVSVIAHSYLTIRDFALYFFPHYFSIFLVILFRYMESTLQKYVEIGKKLKAKSWLTPNVCNTYFQRYEAILYSLNALNRSLSIPVFLVCVYHATGVFFGVMMYEGILHSIKKLFYTAISFLLFTFITFSASAINEVDKTAKYTNIKILSLLSPEERNRMTTSFELLSQNFHAPAFAISGWGFFYLTKSFYLTAIGCLITYGLLLVNM